MTQPNTLDSTIDQLLEIIEQRELSSLRWGYVDGSLSEQEVFTLAESILIETETALEAEYLVGELIDRRLLFEFSLSDGTYGYRSRFAEGVRLLGKLKQSFPDQSWLTAPNLVSDYRVDARPKMVPKRDIRANDAIESLGLPATGLQRQVASAILHPDGEEFHLSQFQVEAAQRILQSKEANRGIVVSAGTGSGKTLAFYLPAMIEVCTWIDNGSRWVKALAIYPRRELLKDQFSEAFRFARSVDDVLKTNGRRSLTIGTFFGLTPNRCDSSSIERANWARVPGGYICPFLMCPDCGEQMIWRDGDITQKVELLTCRNTNCNLVVTEEQVTLTRQGARERPPDIVFTTVEMLHQRLCDTRQRVALGLHRNPERRARIVLLDEIHTYEGATGAQSALAIRRWRHVNGRPVQFVGLSATLREAPKFFAELIGLTEYKVFEVTPRQEDLEPIGVAYQVILRGDPVSQTSLLSTSIQSSFLMARMLDPSDNGRSGGRFGHRVFVFTDDLDVTNRLFDSLRDAEAYDIFGRPDPRREPLANLRGSNQPNPRSQDIAGQRWRVCEEIGWPLNQRLRLSRTTSQDQGVDSYSNVVVATAALEVGFDDPGVGAVLQHKSPHLLASFVQRKGRAGRPARMRPWMVTILSDYGRDRLTYQAYEQLFDPTLPPQRLPIKNRYILRMQAVFAFIDWLAEIARASGYEGWWWRTLNGPTDYQSERGRQKWVQNTLKQLLRREGSLSNSLQAYLEKSLQIERDEVAALLWEPPRSLMLEVIPTLARRLATDWRIAPNVSTGQLTDLMAPERRVHPLPDFIPPNLFSELNLPEVMVVVPPATVNHEERVETMPIAQALGQLVPGRVSRRFAYERGNLNHWIPVPIDTNIYDLPIGDYMEQYEYVGHMTAAIESEIRQVPCFRPITVRLESVSSEHVRPTSYARLLWSSEIIPTEAPLAFQITQRRGWGRFIRAVDFYVHAFHTAITVRRFATEAVANIRRPRVEDELSVRIRFRDDSNSDEPAAVGFEQEVDGLVTQVELPDMTTFVERAEASTSLPTWRAMYFRDCILNDPSLEAEANWFQRDWLHQIYLSALVAEACHRGVSLQEARDYLEGLNYDEPFRNVVETIFRIAEHRDEEISEERLQAGRLEQRLHDLLSRPQVLNRLHTLAESLWNPDQAGWGQWLIKRSHETLGEAVKLACLSIAPRHAAIETLLLDLDRSVAEAVTDSGHAEIWITESTPGGTGVIESIAEAFAADQRGLFTALEAALAPGDLELASTNLDSIIQLLNEDAQVASAAERVRQSQDHVRRSAGRSELFKLLAQRGVGIHHALSAALEHRLLRNGMDSTSDQLIGSLINIWREYEAELGVAIDVRVFCYLAIVHPELGPRINAWLSEMNMNDASLSAGEAVGVLAGILWPRPAEIRCRSLSSYSPFRELGQTDPNFVRDLLLSQEDGEIEFGATSWYEELLSALAETGRVKLIASKHDEDALQRELLSLFATPIDVDYLQFYPVVEQAAQDNTTISLTLILREVAVV